MKNEILFSHFKKGVKSDITRPNEAKKKQLTPTQIQWVIRYQFHPKGKLTYKNWIIDNEKYPELTEFNLEVLTISFKQMTGIEINADDYLQAFLSMPLPENWDAEIKELESFFAKIELPPQPIKLNNYCTIDNVSGFIDGHLQILKTYNGNKSFLPYLNRLQELKKYHQYETKQGTLSY